MTAQTNASDMLAVLEKKIDQYSDDCYSDGKQGIPVPSEQSIKSREALASTVAAIIEERDALKARNAEVEAISARLVVMRRILMHAAGAIDPCSDYEAAERACNKINALAAENKALRELLAADVEYDAASIELAAQENADDDDELYLRALARFQWASDRRSNALARCKGGA